MKRIIFTAIAFMMALFVYAQSQNLDSLLNVLNNKDLKPDEEVSIYKKLCNIYLNTDPVKLAECARKVLDITLKNDKDKYTIATSYYFIGVTHDIRYEFDSAYIYYQKALEIAQEIDNVHTQISVYIGLGIINIKMNDYKKSLENYILALSLAESSNNKPQQITILSNIGTLYQNLGNYTHALQYFQRLEVIAEEIDKADAKCMAYFNIGNIYQTQGDEERALEYELKSLEISRSISLTRYEIGSLLVIAQIYYSDKFKEYDKAEKYATESLLIAEKYEDPLILTHAYATLAAIYRLQEKYEKFDAAAQKAWEMDTTNIVEGKDYIAYIIHANIFLGNKNKALQYLEKYHEIIKQLNDQQLNDSLSDMEVKYETEKKEMRISSLEKEKRMYVWLGLAGGLAAIAFGVGMLQTIRNARKKRQLVATKSIMDGEMRERARLARDLHDRLSGNLNAVKMEINNQEKSLHNISEHLDVCIRDIRDAAHGLMPVSLQYGLKVALEDYAVKFSNVRFHFFGENRRYEDRLEYVVYCCATELVYNAVKHANANSINMQLIQHEHNVTLSVTDDGCGYNEHSATKGIGMKNIRDRVASCNGKIDVITSPGKGTETTIALKI